MTEPVKPPARAEAMPDVQAVRAWLREPDYAESFSLNDVVEWMNRRPIAAFERIAAAPASPPAEALPSQTSGAEAVGERFSALMAGQDPAEVWRDRAFKLAAELDALAKPSSPAGVDVDEKALQCACDAISEAAAMDRESVDENVARAAVVAYRAALSPSTSAAEPVAWLTKWQFKAPDYSVKYPGGGSSITRDATEAAQELANKQRWDRVDWVRQSPLYAHPAPAAVENAQGVRCLATGNPVGTDTWQVGHPCRCANCASLATEKEG